MAISNKALEITTAIYHYYGSDSGCLFGIPPDMRKTVEVIVQKVLDYLAEEAEANNDKT